MAAVTMSHHSSQRKAVAYIDVATQTGAPTPVVEYITPDPVVFTTSTPVKEYVASTPVNEFVVSAQVIEYVAPAPVIYSPGAT